MTEKFENKNLLSDEELVAMFFDENRQELADEGFSQHVMKQLPSQSSLRLRRVWTLLCWLVGIAFFFFADGIGQVKRVAVNALGNFEGFLTLVDFSSLPITTILAAILLIAFIVAWELSEKIFRKIFRTSPF